jgi:Spy/CpxP family protein refolding chaperone
MFGFVIGTACLIGLVKVLRHGRGWGGRGCYGGGRWGRYAWLRRLLRELDATPAQEREVRSAVEEFLTAVDPLRDGLHRAGEDLGAALRGDALDDGASRAAAARLDELFAKAKDAMVTLLQKLHAVLDKDQRERLARFLEHGPGGRHCGGPYRSAGRCAA